RFALCSTAMQRPVPALRPLSQLQSEFVPRFIEHGDAYRAAIESGYSETTARQAAGEILNRPAVCLAIAKAARLRLAKSVPLSIATLEWLRDNSPSDRVRMDSATRLLDRAGLVPPKADDSPSAAEKPLNEATTEELRALVTRYESELAD